MVVVSVGVMIFSMAFLATAFTDALWQLMLTRVLMGFAQSIVTPFSCGLIQAAFPVHQQGIAFGIFNVGVYIAFSLSLSLGVYLYDEYGWKAGYKLFGFIGLLVSTASGVFVFFFGLRLEIPDTEDDVTMATEESDAAYNPLTTAMEPLSSRGNAINSTADEIKNGSSSHGLLNASDDSKISPASDFKTRYSHVFMFAMKQYFTQPVILVISIATGIRLGGGYVWSAYTAIFYSNLFDEDSSSKSCTYSYNATATFVSSMCAADYPYCRSDTCYALNAAPWHNRGIDHRVLEEYMSWVPLAGSAVGTILGGYLTDHIISQQTSSNVALASVWRLVASGAGTLLATPLVVVSFFLSSPGCFLAMVGSGLIGEVYLGQTLAVISSLSSPSVLVTSG